MHVLIFTGGEFTKPADAEVFFQNIKKIDFVVAADSGLQAALQYSDFFKGRIDFEPDVILGDMDSLQNADAVLAGFPSEKIIKHNPYKDLTDTELALDYVYEKFFDNVNADKIGIAVDKQKLDSDLFVTLIGGSGGRVDHLLGIFDLFSWKTKPSVWLCGSQAIWYSCEGVSFKIANLRQNDYVSVARLNGSREGGKIVSEGLEWESPLFRKSGMPSISNRISADFFEQKKNVTIKITEGEFLLILPVCAKVEKG